MAHPIQWLYNAAVWCAQPLLRRKLARRARAEPLYGQFVPERFGIYSQPPEHQSHLVWVHAVSLGETRAAQVIIQAMRQTLPGVRLLLTHGTATGRAEGARLLQPGDIQVWQPWDTPQAVARFLSHFQPRIGVLMETEVWPNLVLQSQRVGIPLVLANARMSEKSMLKALSWPSLTRPLFHALKGVWAQTERDADRLRLLGASQVVVMGNVKFDARPDSAQCALGRSWRVAQDRSVVMLASSREGEEEAWLNQWMSELQMRPSNAIQWLIVPRHPQRVDEVEALILAKGFNVSRRSQWGNEGPQRALQSTLASAAPSVWLGDSLGEMALYYSLSDVALLGGSYAPFGGQNLIEAAACGCPIVLGPHTFNFAQAAEMAIQEGAALRARDMAHALQQVSALIKEPEQLACRSTQARVFAQAHQGAAMRTAQALAQLLE